MNVDLFNEPRQRWNIFLGKQHVKTYSASRKSWDGSDDEKEDHEYLVAVAISEDGPTHISQVSIS